MNVPNLAVKIWKPLRDFSSHSIWNRDSGHKPEKHELENCKIQKLDPHNKSPRQERKIERKTKRNQKFRKPKITKKKWNQHDNHYLPLLLPL